MSASAYDLDFYGWTQEQAVLMKHRRINELDWEHLIEEVESMGARERRELVNRLCILLMHLLKWQYQPNYRGRSWVNSIREQRRMIPKHMKDNPSLKSSLSELWEEAYEDARKEASDETSLPLQTFPEQCQFTIEDALNPDFFPDSVN